VADNQQHQADPRTYHHECSGGRASRSLAFLREGNRVTSPVFFVCFVSSRPSWFPS
jgi:hypothetical protein